MKASPYLPTVCSFAWASALLLPFSVAWEYRPLCRPMTPWPILERWKSSSVTSIWNETGVSRKKKNPTLGEKLMGKSIFWLFGIFLLVFQDSGSVWAQDQAEGKKLYATYCSTCHGDNGKGDGQASKSLPVKPADHTNGSIMNQLSDK